MNICWKSVVGPSLSPIPSHHIILTHDVHFSLHTFATSSCATWFFLWHVSLSQYATKPKKKCYFGQLGLWCGPISILVWSSVTHTAVLSGDSLLVYLSLVSQQTISTVWSQSSCFIRTVYVFVTLFFVKHLDRNIALQCIILALLAFFCVLFFPTCLKYGVRFILFLCCF